MLSAIVLLVGLAGVHLVEAILNQMLDVKIAQGTVRGFINEDQSFYSYIGIPYGAVSHDNRFKHAAPAPKINGTLIANNTVTCAQYTPSGQAVGVENCLVVNIFISSNISLTSKTPVLVAVHGGSYLFNSAEIVKKKRLINQGLVVVTVNTRLGMLGYLCLHTEAAPCNAGIKDLVFALKWINQNIAAFGGDKGNVAVFGESVGAAMIELIMLSKAADGLFHKVILESGTAIANWGVGYNAVKLATQVAGVLGFNNVTDVSKLEQIFLDASTKDLTTAITKLAVTIVPSIFSELVAIENASNPGAVVTKDPLTALEEGSYTKVPIMVAFMTIEASYLEAAFTSIPGYRSNFVNSPENLILNDLIFPDPATKRKTIGPKANFYKRLNQNNTLNAFLDFMTDTQFVVTQILDVLYHSGHGEDVYLMNFAYHDNKARGSKHTDLYHYVFETELAGQNGAVTADRVAALFGNFVKTGKPVPKTTALLPVLWSPVAMGNKTNYLLFSDKLSIDTLENSPWYARFKLWKQLYASNYNPRKL